MILANTKFNHENDVFHQSIGISNEIRTKCRERIFFTSLSNAIQTEELFEDPDDAPRELRTVSGNLHRLLNSITDNLEYEYTLLIFNNYERMAKQTYAYFKHMQENKQSTEEKLKSAILELVEEMHKQREEDDDSDNDADNLPIDQLNKKSMLKRISLVKNSHHNFNTYMNLLNRWVNNNDNQTSESKPDIDDILRNLFSKDNEDE